MSMATAIKPQPPQARRTSRALEFVWRSLRTHWDVWLLVVFLVGFFIFELANLGSASVEYDEGVYWQSLRNLAAGHPLFGEVFSSQPPLFLISILPIYLLAGQTLFAARLAVVVYGAIGLVATWWLGRRIGGGPLGGALACALLVSQSVYIHGAHTLDAEIPMLAVALIAVAVAQESTRHVSRRKTLIALSGIFCVFAIMMKLFAVVALAPVVLYVAAPSLGALLGSQGTSGAARRQIASQLGLDLALLGGAVLATFVLLLLPYANQLDRVYAQAIQFHITASVAVPYQWQDTLNRVWGTEWPTIIFKETLVVLALLAIFPSRQKLLQLAPMILWLVLSFAVLVQQRPLLAHHFVILAPPLAVILGGGIPLLLKEALGDLRRVPALASRVRAYVSVAFLALVLITFGHNLQLSASDLHRTGSNTINSVQKAMIRSIQANVPPGAWLVSDDQYVAALAGHSVPPELVDTSEERVLSGYLTATQLEAIIAKYHVSAILFASGRFDGVAGFRGWVAGHYSLVGQFLPGQTLYVLTPAASSAGLRRPPL